VEVRRIKTNVGKALVEFARAHASDTVADFDFAKPASAGGYTPAHPFHPHGDAKAIAAQVVKFFDRWPNNNHWQGGFTSRVVLGREESQHILDAIEKL